MGGGGKKIFRGIKWRKKGGWAKKRSSWKIWGNRVKKASSRPKVGKHPQMGQFEHILENADSGYEGEI